MGVTVPEVIGDGPAVGRERDRMGLCPTLIGVPLVKRCIAVRLRPEVLPG